MQAGFIGRPHQYRQIPDYLNDLNAMNEAEKALTYHAQPYFILQLKRVIILVSDNGSADDFSVANASASQRAEAFLKALNLWTE